jgi:MOSC domain-containing protein
MHLSALHLYPVKSCGSLSPAEWPLDRIGLRHDRRWMVVSPEGRFLTQREIPGLALVRPRLEGENLILAAPGLVDHVVPLTPAGGRRFLARIWNDRVEAWLPDPEADQWFSDYLSRDTHLAYFPASAIRRVDPTYALQGAITAFSDGFPLLLIGDASLADLNARMGRPLPMNRFRPNLVVSGSEAYAEDGWRRITLGRLELAVVKPCVRCVIPTTNQDTAERGQEPLRTLATYRRWGQGVAFGQNVIPLGEGVVRRGAEVAVVR